MMQTPGQRKGRTERRQATGVRQALLLSSAGHLLALAAWFLLGSGVPTRSAPAAVDVVLVTAEGSGRAEFAGPGRGEFLGASALRGPAPEPLNIGRDRAAKRPDRRKVASPPRLVERRVNPAESDPPRRSAAPVLPEVVPFRTERAWAEGFTATILPPEGGPSPAKERPTGTVPAWTADVAAEAVRDADPESLEEADGPRETTASAGIGGNDGARAGMAAGPASTSATLRDGPGGGGAGGGEDGAAAARLRDAIQSRIVYPDEAVRRGLEGEVLLRIRIGKEGRPGEIRVAKSSGARILDEAARRGVIRAAPLPSAPGWVEVPVRFFLRRPAGERS